MIRTGGIALVLAATLFIAVFSYLAAVFDYPEVLNGSAADVLPRLLAIGATGRAIWWIYSLLPLLLVPAGLAAHDRLQHCAPAAARLSLVAAVLAAATMSVGLARWPSIHWALATAHVGASADQRESLAALFDGLNLFLGRFIGEFVGELALATFFAATAFGLRHLPGGSAWLSRAGMTAAIVGSVAMFRNVTDAVGFIADMNNVVLPVWLIVLGGALARDRGESTTVG